MTSCLLSTVIHHSFQLYKKPFTALRLLKSRWKWLSEYTLPKESYQRAGVTALHHLCACGTEFHCPPCSRGHSRAYSRAPPWPFNTPGSGRWQTKASALLFLLQTRPGRTVELLKKSWDNSNWAGWGAKLKFSCQAPDLLRADHSTSRCTPALQHPALEVVKLGTGTQQGVLPVAQQSGIPLFQQAEMKRFA